MTQLDINLQEDFNRAFTALQRDLVDEHGPRISTMRNYRFATLLYRPEREFDARRRIHRLCVKLESHDMTVLRIDLHKLLLDRIASHGDRIVERLIERERRTAQKQPERALHYVQEKISHMLEGPDGLSADICTLINQARDDSPERFEQTVIFLERAGSLFSLMRLSALLKHLDGRTHNVPVILFYPGTRTADGLSLMGIMPPDRDYRTRIYS